MVISLIFLPLLLLTPSIRFPLDRTRWKQRNKRSPGGTPYDDLYGETPPERGTFFGLLVYERVGISLVEVYLSIIPRARMGSESIAHEGEGNNCFNKIQLVGKKYRDKTISARKTRFSHHCFGFQCRRFSLLVGYNSQVVAQPIRTQH